MAVEQAEAAHAARTDTRAERSQGGRHETTRELLTCLLVTEVLQRAESFRTQVANTGWETTVCIEALSAAQMIERYRFDMVIVDMQAGLDGAPENFTAFAERVAKDRCLLVIWGDGESSTEELWARQLGAWLYMPAVTQASDFHAIGTAAREVVDRTQQTLVRRT